MRRAIALLIVLAALAGVMNLVTRGALVSWITTSALSVVREKMPSMDGAVASSAGILGDGRFFNPCGDGRDGQVMEVSARRLRGFYLSDYPDRPWAVVEFRADGTRAIYLDPDRDGLVDSLVIVKPDEDAPTVCDLQKSVPVRLGPSRNNA